MAASFAGGGTCFGTAVVEMLLLVTPDLIQRIVLVNAGGLDNAVQALR